MNKEHIPVITDREELYDKCKNMEQLYDKYYLPLLDVHYRKTYELQQENKKLKKQLEEKQNPLKGIFAQVNDDILLRDCGNMNAEINEYKNQQKEFIEYLEEYIKEISIQHINLHPSSQIILEPIIDTLKTNLSKYKQIIGKDINASTKGD